jgi:hypothetical protein
MEVSISDKWISKGIVLYGKFYVPKTNVPKVKPMLEWCNNVLYVCFKKS